MSVDLHVVLGGDRGDRRVDQRLPARLVLQRSRPHVDAKHGEVGDDISRAAAVDLRGVHRQRFIHARLEPQSQVRGRNHRIAPILGVAAGMRGFPGDGESEVAASRPCSGKRAVRVGRRFIGQRRALAPGRPRDEVGRPQRADFLVAIDDDLIADPPRRRSVLDRLQRGEHDRDSALHVGDAGAVQHFARLQPA